MSTNDFGGDNMPKALFGFDVIDFIGEGAGSAIYAVNHPSSGLEALHHMGYIHCDLKPNNILVDPGGQVKVIDLGQACKVGTAKSRIQGTPDFIAPEQVKCEAVTARTDVFNLGATMYWTL